MPWFITKKSLTILLSTWFLFQSSKENIRFQFIERSSTTIISGGFVSNSNKKNHWDFTRKWCISCGLLWCPCKWKLESGLLSMPFSSTTFVRWTEYFNYFLWTSYLHFFSNFNDLTQIYFLVESFRAYWSCDWRHARRCWCSHGVSVWSWHS